ncbi:Fic family protein [Tuanshanicoccus yangjingiae]|uniref:Fic family protein n=1 Tax=Aerococcaceae bacterium zg-252 TaxID=2796928 RepID=UPI0040635148
MLRGTQKFPIAVPYEKSIEIYKLLAQTNKIIGKLDMLFERSIINKSMISILSYHESVQSTRIEGTQVTFHEILENKEKTNLSWQQQEVINYRHAIDYGFSAISQGNSISSRMLKEIHKILMTKARGTTANGGEFRKIQNFIGPDNKIENATYIPVNANEIGEYMSNLEYFINGQPHVSFSNERKENFDYYTFDSDPLLRIALAHAQFESIHPFLDGNGRLGRILIALMAVQEGIMSVPLFFVSEELEKERIRYYNALNSTRGDSPSWETWIEFFLRCSGKMAENLILKIEAAESVAADGLSLCTTETHKNVWLTTFSDPVLTAAEVSNKLKIHSTTAKKALDYLVSHKLLDKDLSAKRNVKYYNYGLLSALKIN